MLIADGKMSLDDPVSRFIPEWRAGASGGVTVRHLLTMTSGLPDERQVSDVGGVEDKERFVFGLPIATRPGERWAYTNNGVFLLSPLLDRAAGEPIDNYARRRLFEPLGMKGSEFHVYPEGQAWTHADMHTTPRDLARIGQMMLSGGRWEGRQIVPESWVNASVQPLEGNRDYRLLWWLNVPGGFAARGYLDTNLYVLPDVGIVVVRMQSAPRASSYDYEPRAFDLFRRIVGR
jgi:CubicO group peptidase (beta-lactamase class C family)